MSTTMHRKRPPAGLVSPANTSIQFGSSSPRPFGRYVSDMAVLEEALDHGRLIRAYWSASGQVHRENIAAHEPRLDSLRRPLHVFELEIDGQSLHNRWDWGQTSQRPGERPGTTEAVLTLKHQLRPVTVNVVTRLDGTPIMARYLEITNTGAVPAALSHVAPWSGVLWDTKPTQFTPESTIAPNPSFDEHKQGKFTLGYFAAENLGDEGDFIWQPLPQENFRLERAALGCSTHGWPYYVLRNEVTGEMFFMGLAWGGNLFAEFSYRHESLLTFRMGPLAPAPLRMIAPGETVRSPEVHAGPLHGSLDEGARHWHRHMRASVIPPRPAGRNMYTVAGRVVEEPGEWILREIDLAAEMGVEAFMVDAGWYGSTFSAWPELRGDWTEGDWLPGGLAGVRNYAHDKGMLFGLWHEAEALADKSQTRQQHPDWTLCTDDNRPCAEALDLANPAAATHFEASVLRVIRDYKADFYKLDYNVRVGEGGQTLRDGYAESEFWRHYEVLGRVYRRVLKECPEVVLENCASGGGRNDLGTLSLFHYCCESDISMFPYSIRAINAMTLFVPPEAICYYHNHIHFAHQMADLDTHLRVTLFATPIFVGFGAQHSDRTTDYYHKTRRYIGLHKGFCRPILAAHPVVYHHTPDIGLQPAPWCVLEYAAPDRSRGYAGIFKLDNQREAYTFRPRGVDPAKTYKVTLDNEKLAFVLPGFELRNTGLRIEPGAALTSELVMYDEVKN